MRARDAVIEAVPLVEESGEVVWQRFSGHADQCATMDAEWADRVFRTRHPLSVACALSRFVMADSLRAEARKADPQGRRIMPGSD